AQATGGAQTAGAAAQQPPGAAQTARAAPGPRLRGVAVGAELAGEAAVDVGAGADAGEARRQAGGAAEAALLGGAAVDAVEQLGQVVGRAVLHLVDEQLRLDAVEVGAVELLDPVARLVQVGGARGDHQHGGDALGGGGAQGAEQGAGFAQAGRRGRLAGGRRGLGAGRGRPARRGGGAGRAGAGGTGGGRGTGGARGGAAREQAQRGLDLG